MIDISFVIIAYNEAQTIGRCIKAVLDQENHLPYEIVVIDDGSTDETAKIVAEYATANPNIKLHRSSSNQGRGAARAVGIGAAIGKYIAFVDADIVLPPLWLKTCLEYISDYDAVGGVAVPDGDVNYIYAQFGLKPKVSLPTTLVSGSNGLYKRIIFENINFDGNFRDGEDSVFNKLLIARGFKIHSIKSLVVEHKESRKFLPTLYWLYQTGKGATRQFKQFKEVRLPDIVTFVLACILVVSIGAAIFFKEFVLVLLPPIFILLVDIIHFQRKFFFKFSYFARYIFGILTYWLMLASYFTGRIAGIFAPLLNEPRQKRVMICFDFEGKLGMPFNSDYDLVATTHNILNVLDKYGVKAVFFVVGELVEEYSQLIKEIANRGHEIALHGYLHNHLNKASKEELIVFGENLSKVEEYLRQLIGKRPTGFRAPYLMAPAFYTDDLYQILRVHGYEWVSNREIRYPDELFRPDRIWIRALWGSNNWFMRMLLPILNLRMIFTEHIDDKKGIARIISNIKWLSDGAAPFKRYNILEIPIHSPLDCDLLGLPEINEHTSEKFLQYAVKSLIGGLSRKGDLYTITLHDWIIGSNNRILVLERVLETFLRNKNISFVSVPIKNQI